MSVSETTPGAHVAQGVGRRRFSLLELTLDYSNQGLAMVDSRGQVLIFNKRALEYTGVDPQTFKLPATANEVRQWQLQSGEFGPDGSLLPEEVRSYFMTGVGTTPKSYIRKRPNGTVLEIRSEPLPGGGIVQSYTDITELTEAKEGAEAGARAKSAFLATMSHEIRTPLNGVLGVAALLRQTKLTTEQAEYVRIIMESGDALLTVINDILDFSKLEAGMMEVDRTPTRLRESATAVLELVRATAASKGLNLSLQLDSNIPEQILIDAKRVRQVLLNLISNAVKFTPKGSVTLKITTGLSGNIRFEIRDTGIGISPEGQKRLFKEFSQVDGSIDRQFGGTGLGLAICKKIVGVMQGTIGVESREGAGSCFWFEIPAQAYDAAPESVADQQETRLPDRSCHILVVEDMPTNQLVARKMLENMGHTVDIAANGLQALELARTKDYDLIFMDMQMPVMNGLDATRRLRRYGGRFETVPIIAMTANASTSDEDECRAAGMNDFISKPIAVDALRLVVNRAVAGIGVRLEGDDAARSTTRLNPVIKDLTDYIGSEAVNHIVMAFEDALRSRLTVLENGPKPVRQAEIVSLHNDASEGLFVLGLNGLRSAEPLDQHDADSGMSLPEVRAFVEAAVAQCRALIAAGQEVNAAAQPQSKTPDLVWTNLVAYLGDEASREIISRFEAEYSRRLADVEHGTGQRQQAELSRFLNDFEEGLAALGLASELGASGRGKLSESGMSLLQLRRRVDDVTARCRAAAVPGRPSVRSAQPELANQDFTSRTRRHAVG